jgi:hypothetical protein
MRHTLLLLVSICAFSSMAIAQNFAPQKDLVFGQVAAGGGYESVITVTNRGAVAYSGTLYLYRGQANTDQAGQPWNPIVNDVEISAGKIDVSIPVSGTTSYRISRKAETQSGYAMFIASDVKLGAFLEGNLTYYTRSSGRLTDSTGVSPSTEFYISTVPFEDSGTVALALVNGGSAAANVNLLVLTDTSVVAGTSAFTLGAKAHAARFLSQFVANINVPRGRLEITADKPLFGTALSYVDGQASSLPLLPSPRSYLMSITTPSRTLDGNADLWVEGPYLKGYLRFSAHNGSTIPVESYYVSGQLANKVATIQGHGTSTLFGDQEINFWGLIKEFGVAATSSTGGFSLSRIQSNVTEEGTITLRPLTSLKVPLRWPEEAQSCLMMLTPLGESAAGIDSAQYSPGTRLEPVVPAGSVQMLIDRPPHEGTSLVNVPGQAPGQVHNYNATQTYYADAGGTGTAVHQDSLSLHVQSDGSTAVTSLLSFTFYYQYEPKGYRYWSQVSASRWVERYPDNSTYNFTVEERMTLDGVAGTVVRKEDGMLVFIPDKGASSRMLRFRWGSGAWQNLAELTYNADLPVFTVPA